MAKSARIPRILRKGVQKRRNKEILREISKKGEKIRSGRKLAKFRVFWQFPVEDTCLKSIEFKFEVSRR